jgi:hypothetical protein
VCFGSNRLLEDELGQELIHSTEEKFLNPHELKDRGDSIFWEKTSFLHGFFFLFTELEFVLGDDLLGVAYLLCVFLSAKFQVNSS